MKLVYMGTPDFAVPALFKLHEAGFEISAVVTQPDKVRDRGKKLQFPPVKEAAVSLGIPVLQPEKIKGNEEFYRQLSELKPDVIVVAAYGKILPKQILELPPAGCVNIHASLLPRYRGAAPIHRAIIEGEEETGVTLMYMAEGMDTGDMIARVKTPIADKTVAELHTELAELGGDLLLAHIEAIVAGTAERIPQDDAQATYAPMIFKQDCFVDFHSRPNQIKRLIQGANSWPGANTNYLGQNIKLWEAEVPGEKTEVCDGTILAADKKGLAVAAAGEIVRITKLQFPGKRAMSVEDYLKGNKIEIGQILG